MAAIAYYEKLVTEDIDVGIGTVTKRNPGGGSLSGTQVGIHTFAVGGAKVSASWDPSIVATGGSVSTTVTVPGAALNDFVLASFSVSLQGLSPTAVVTATNTVTVVLANNTGSAIDLPALTVNVLVLNSR